MKILGLIVEYNPLHNGHIHHLKQSKKLVEPDITIAVMSGHFTQRGEPACTTKWLRTSLALASDIDLIIELPYAYSNQSADLFATGAISILNHLGATHIVFGSESGDIKELTNLAHLLDDPEFQGSVKKGLARGISLPAAHALANPALTGSNNTLAIQYIRAIKKLGAIIIPLTICRNIDYNEQQPTHATITSATSIRNLINADLDYQSYVPQKLTDPYIKFQNWNNHYKFLRHKLLTISSGELFAIHDMIEGIENRLISSARLCSNWEDFLARVATKRYTKTRIQRICANVLTGFTKSDMKNWNLHDGAPYVRILGFNEKGSTYLRQAKGSIRVPIYSIFAQNAHPMLKHEQKVTSAYASVYYAEYATKIIQQEYQNKPVIANPIIVSDSTLPR